MFKKAAAIALCVCVITALLLPSFTANAADAGSASYTVRHHIVSPDRSQSYVFLQTNESTTGAKTAASALSIPGCTVRSFAQKPTASDRTVLVDIYYDTDPDLEPGDVNADGVVDPIDAAILDRYLADWDGYGFEALNLYYADTNGDGTVDITDALNIRRLLVLEEAEEADVEDPWSPWI